MDMNCVYNDQKWSPPSNFPAETTRTSYAEDMKSSVMDTDVICDTSANRKGNDIRSTGNGLAKTLKPMKTTSKKLIDLPVEKAEERRLRNNENERVRTHAQVDALNHLARALPPEMMARKRWSKQLILSSAIGYIRFLDDLLTNEKLTTKYGLGQWEDDSGDFLKKLQLVKERMGKEWSIRNRQDTPERVVTCSSDDLESNDSVNSLDDNSGDAIVNPSFKPSQLNDGYEQLLQEPEFQQKQQQQQTEQHQHHQQQQEQKEKGVAGFYDLNPRPSFGGHQNSSCFPNEYHCAFPGKINVDTTSRLTQSSTKEHEQNNNTTTIPHSQNNIDMYSYPPPELHKNLNHAHQLTQEQTISTHPFQLRGMQQQNSLQEPFHGLQQQHYHQMLQQQQQQHRRSQHILQHQERKHLFHEDFYQMQQQFHHQQFQQQQQTIGPIPVEASTPSDGQSLIPNDPVNFQSTNHSHPLSQKELSTGEYEQNHAGVKQKRVGEDPWEHRWRRKIQKGDVSNRLEDSGYISSPGYEKSSCVSSCLFSPTKTGHLDHFFDDYNPDVYQTSTPIMSNIPRDPASHITTTNTVNWYGYEQCPNNDPNPSYIELTTRKRNYTHSAFSVDSNFPVISLNPFFDAESSSDPNDGTTNLHFNNFLSNRPLAPTFSSTPRIQKPPPIDGSESQLVDNSDNRKTLHCNLINLPLTNGPNLSCQKENSKEEIDYLFAQMQGAANGAVGVIKPVVDSLSTTLPNVSNDHCEASPVLDDGLTSVLDISLDDQNESAN